MDETLIEVLSKYSEYVDGFSSNLAIGLPAHTRINDHEIELKEDKQPLSSFIHSLGLIELETFKTYIKTYLITGFI